MKKILMVLGLVLVLSGVSNAANTSVTFNWTAVGDDGNTGTAAQYELYMSTSPITDANFASATKITGIGTLVPKVAGSAETYTTTIDLASQTTYYFALRVRDEANNWSLVSNNASRTTPDTVPPSMINTLTVTFGS